MKRQLRSILGLGIFGAVLLGVSASNSFAQIGPAEFDDGDVATNTPTWVTLTDGSRLVVELDPMVTFRFSSDLVEVDLTGDDFSMINFADEETVTVQFNNGDRLTGQLNLDSLLVTTSWGGAIEIEREFLQSIVRVDFNYVAPNDHFFPAGPALQAPAIPGLAPQFFPVPVLPTLELTPLTTPP